MKLNHVIFENQEHEEIKSKVLGRTRSCATHHSALSNTQLINDHDPHALASKIVRIDREQLGYDEALGGFPGQSHRVPTRRKWDHCNICLQLTGTKVYFGGSAEFKRYHLSAKWVHIEFNVRVCSNRFQGTGVTRPRMSPCMSVGR